MCPVTVTPKWESAAPHYGGTSGPLLPFDASKPNIARAYDYMLGGKAHFPPDRELAEGIIQYADLSAGLPTSPAVHEIVRRHSRCATVAYVDNDPVVLNHLYVMAAKPDRHVAAIPGDLADPAATLAALKTTGAIDFGAPACLILAMVLHFMDAPTARQVVSDYVAALSPAAGLPRSTSPPPESATWPPSSSTGSSASSTAPRAACERHGTALLTANARIERSGALVRCRIITVQPG
jgi:hypothetical protein